MSGVPLYTVLNVDEVQATRHARTATLRQAGYRVIEAVDQEEALCLAEQESPALFLPHADSEARLRILADNAPALIWMNGPNGCEYVNRAYLRFLGVSEKEVRGFGWARFIHPEDRDGHVQAYLEAAAQRTLFEAKFRFLRDDGEYRWMKSVGTPRIGDQGEVLGYVGSSVDISDVQLVAEQAGRERDRVLRQTLDAAGMIVWHVNLITGVVRETGEVWKVFNRPPGFVHHNLDSWKDNVHPEDYARVMAAVQRSIDEGVPFDIEYRTISDSEGRVRWVHSSGTVVCGSDGRGVSAYGIARDITDRKRAEEDLRESRRRAQQQHAELELIYQNVPVGLCVLDREFRFLRMNERLAELNGVAASDHLGRTIREVLPDLEGKLVPVFQRVLETGNSTINVELRGRTPKQPEVERDWIASYVPVRDPDGEIYGIGCVVEEITDRKRAEEALRASEELLRTATDHARVGLAVLDANRRYTFVNPAYRELMGLAGTDMIGRRMDEVLGPLYEQTCQCLDRAYAGERVSYELLIPGAEGESGRSYAVTCEPRWETDTRRVVGMVAAVTDITERKQAEAELKAIAWLLRERETPFTMPEPQPYGDLTELKEAGTILRTVGKDLLTNVTRDAVDLLGSSGAIYEKNGDYASGLFASHWCRFMDEASHARCGTADNQAALASGEWHCHESCWEAASRSMETGEPVDMPCKGGIHLYAVPIKVDGETVGSIDIGYGDPPKDDAALAQLAEHYGVQLEKLRELSASMPSRPQFIVEVAKARLRSSAVLLGEIIKRKRAEEGLRDLTDHLEQRIAERTEELVHSQEQLRALATELNLAEQRERKRLAAELHDYLAQMLVLVRLKLGQSKQLSGPVPRCGEFIAQADDVLTEALNYTRTLVADLSPPVLYEFGLPAALKWLAERMQRHELAVIVDAGGAYDVTLPEDQAVLMFQSVRELLMNAAKYAGSGEATIRLDKHDGLLRVQVRDRGKGFDMAAAATPEDKTVTSKFGLFSIRERMKALGGEFELQSAPGQGATATLTLPLKARDERDMPHKQDEHEADRRDRPVMSAVSQVSSVSPGASSRIRVLLVDDHAMVRQGLRSVLETYADVEVVGEAVDGEEAVASVDRLHPSIVVMDINMPRKSGIEATAAIKAQRPQTVVIGLSVNVAADNRAAMLGAGAAMLLTKEAAVDELYRAIQDVLGRT